MKQVLTVLLVLVLAVVVKLGWLAWGQWSAGREAERQGNSHEAALRYGRVLHLWLPGSPLSERASERLAALSEAATDPAERRYCLEELRSGWLAVRGLWQPGAAWIRLAEDRLVAHIVADPQGTWPERTLPAAEREAEVRKALVMQDPSLGWVLVLQAGLLLWLGATARGFWRAFPVEVGGPVRWGELGRHLAVAALGYGLWLLGVARA